MVVTVLKTTFTKAKPKEIFYRCYKNFDNIKFRENLINELLFSNLLSYSDFQCTFMRVLNKHAPLKKKLLRANNAIYMTKTLRKAIMTRSCLEHKYYKHPSAENNKAYRKQKNFCSRLYKKERKIYYANLDIQNITDNKKFWKTVKPLLSEKSQNIRKITIIKDGEIISRDEEVAETLNSYFKNAVTSLDIRENELPKQMKQNDPIDYALKRYESHPSIINILKKISQSTFSFQNVTLVEVRK